MNEELNKAIENFNRLDEELSDTQFRVAQLEKEREEALRKLFCALPIFEESEVYSAMREENLLMYIEKRNCNFWAIPYIEGTMVNKKTLAIGRFAAHFRNDKWEATISYDDEMGWHPVKA